MLIIKIYIFSKSIQGEVEDVEIHQKGRYLCNVIYIENIFDLSVINKFVNMIFNKNY